MSSGDHVQVEQTLVDVLLQRQGRLHGLQSTTPLITFGFLDISQDDPSTALVLKLHQLLGVLTFLVAAVLEVLVEAGQGDVVAVKVPGLEGESFL